MKLFNKSIYALTLASMMGLWSCTSEEVLPDVVNSEGSTVRLTLNVSRAPQTRTSLSEDGQGGLTSEWKETDKLGVMLSKTGKVGELSFVEYPDENNKSVAIFSGELTGVSEGLAKTMIYHCDESVIDKTNSTARLIRIPLNNQKYHSVEDLSAMDVLYQRVDLNVKNGVAHVTKDEVMKPLLALAHFNLTGLPDKTEGTLYVGRVAGESNIYYEARLRTYEETGELTPGFLESSKITELKAEVNSDHQVYMALPANYYKEGEKYHELTLSFRFVAKDGTEYTYAFTQPTEIKAGLYYNSFADGEASGIEIPLENTNTVDHSKNPLAKWATTNLVFDKTTRTSTFASSEYEGGSLYQWGRNDGYDDYADAMGGIDSNTGNYKYATYQTQFFSGEGFSNQYNGTNRSSMIYTSAYELTTVTKSKRMYFINPYIKYNGVDVAKDYWPWTNGGTNWESRATACGYTATSPAPKGWKLPTIADFKEIYPTEAYNWEGTNNLADNVNNKLMEIRKIADVCTYAIRWDIETNSGKKVLKIRALVVPDSYENTDTYISKVNWSDKNVEERIFPATGAIEAYYHQHYNNQGTTMDLVRPMPFGNWNVELRAYPSIVNAKYWAVQYLNIVDAGKTQEGAYWTSDDTYIFRFRNNNGQFGSNNTTSFIGASDQPTSNAFAIRCVKAN